ncbi:MAG: type II toxin-antitoxin system VapC family toxin [Chloroflexi bacterium]|nr:type II toxin-antitoxin system VapC family toxin [Chloroflexota bacterium]
MAEIVLDASALLTLFQLEPGADIVAQRVGNSAVSAVNFSEVVAKLAEKGVPEAAIRSHLTSLKMQTVAFDVELAYSAGLLRPDTRSLGLSLGDRSCLALAQMLGLPVLTGDRRWRELGLEVEVRLIR